MTEVKIYVTLKEGILDVQGKTILRALRSLGYDDVDNVMVGKYIRLELDGAKDIDRQIEEMCERLITNPIIEDFSYEVVE